MGGGNDTISCTGNLAALISISVDGGAGNDTILGSNGIDTLIGGLGNDFVDGQQNNDFAFLGAGNDTFQWDPGDGSDTIEGQSEIDTLVFNGSNSAESLEVSANGGRVRVTRNLANIVLDLDDMEKLNFNALGGADIFTASDLAGTDANEVNVFLAVAGLSDGQVDTVVFNGTTGVDTIVVNGNAAGVSVLGMFATVNVYGADSTQDLLTVNLLSGDDVLDAAGLSATGILLTANGGDGDDALTGGDGAALRQWLSGLYTAGQLINTFELLNGLNTRIHESFRYVPRDEHGVQSPAQTIMLGTGSCRDYAVMLMEAVRHWGFGARFVTGYIQMEEGQHGATHAWTEIYIPGAGWRGFDPTNNCFTGWDHVSVAVARDPEKASPLSGVWEGPADAFDRMEVTVQVVKV
jgi:hypothetical protein